MPTYQYKCKACDHGFEEFQSMADDSLTRCPSCGKKKLVRVISGSGLVFKGSGFYLTDYKKPGSSAANPSKDEKPAGEGPADPAAAAEPKKDKEKGKGKEKEKAKPSTKPPSEPKA